MTFEEFDKLTEDILAKVRTIRDTKGREYARDQDRLANFKEIAYEVGITPLQTWFVHFEKHMRSIKSYVRTERVFSDEGIEGRIVDTITYLLLLYGLIKEIDNDRLLFVNGILVAKEGTNDIHNK